jgi:hypothetical protein
MAIIDASINPKDPTTDIKISDGVTQSVPKYDFSKFSQKVWEQAGFSGTSYGKQVGIKNALAQPSATVTASDMFQQFLVTPHVQYVSGYPLGISMNNSTIYGLDAKGNVVQVSSQGKQPYFYSTNESLIGNVKVIDGTPNNANVNKYVVSANINGQAVSKTFDTLKDAQNWQSEAVSYTENRWSPPTWMTFGKTVNIETSGLADLFAKLPSRTTPAETIITPQALMQTLSTPEAQLVMMGTLLPEGQAAMQLVLTMYPQLVVTFGVAAATGIVVNTYQLATNYKNMTTEQIIQSLGTDVAMAVGLGYGISSLAKSSSATAGMTKAVKVRNYDPYSLKNTLDARDLEITFFLRFLQQFVQILF